MDGERITLEAGIVGRDAEVLERFYTEVMGFAVVRRIHFDEFGTVLRLARGDAHCKLYFPGGVEVDPPRPDQPWFQAGGFRYAALDFDDPAEVDALVDVMAAGGGTVLIPPREHRPGARMALVADPEGNPWELLCG